MHVSHGAIVRLGRGTRTFRILLDILRLNLLSVKVNPLIVVIRVFVTVVVLVVQILVMRLSFKSTTTSTGRVLCNTIVDSFDSTAFGYAIA